MKILVEFIRHAEGITDMQWDGHVYTAQTEVKPFDEPISISGYNGTFEPVDERRVRLQPPTNPSQKPPLSEIWTFDPDQLLPINIELDSQFLNSRIDIHTSLVPDDSKYLPK